VAVWTTELAPGRALLPRCLCGLLAAILMVVPWNGQALADEAGVYASLSTSTWGVSGSVTQYQYDANGSVTSKITTGANPRTTQYAYDLRNRLVSLTESSTNNGQTMVSSTSYVYNDAGARVGSQTQTMINGASAGGTTNVFLNDPFSLTGLPQVLEDLPAVGGVPTVSYTVGNDVIAQAATGGSSPVTEYFLRDGHDSVRQLCDTVGNLTAAYGFDAYGVMLGGNPTPEAPANTEMLYSGEPFDSHLQQYNLRARYYDQNLGRFGTQDPFNGRSDDPQSLHKYAYAAGDPVNNSDPTGEAVYYMERQLGCSGGSVGWALNFCHGYLLFTAGSDTGSEDPFSDPANTVTSFSWHPHIWDYTDEEAKNPILPGVPGRVWERHPDDMDPEAEGIPFWANLVTADPGQQAMVLSCVQGFIHNQPVGYELGFPRQDPNDPQNQIGAGHVAAPREGVYYSLTGQNCVWWCTIMLIQSGIPVSTGVFFTILNDNWGGGAASDVISGQRSAYQVGTLNGDYYHVILVVDDYVDTVAFAAAMVGIL
jgi:RHS repeat-associated protein